MFRFMALLACAVLTCLVCLWWLPIASAAELGDCDQPTVPEENKLCMNAQFCFTLGTECQPCHNVIDCNGMSCAYCKYLSGQAIGDCTSVYYGYCTRCPGRILCAKGKAYEDMMCMTECCNIVTWRGPNKCVP